MIYKFSDKVANLAPSAIREIFKSMSVPGMISLAAGNPAAETFPVAELARLSAEIYRTESTAALQYSITEGYPPLRTAVEQRIRQRFGIGRAESRGDKYTDQTIIVSGGQQGIELAVKVLCNEGDAVICENPTFIGGLNAIRSLGAKPIGVPLQGDGIDTDALETIKNNPRARMIYLFPHSRTLPG